MSFINSYGLILMLLIMVPNIIFCSVHKEGLKNKYTNKTVIAFEQIGRYTCFALMIINLPYLYGSYWFAGGKAVYLAVNSVLIVLYCLFWILYWNKNTMLKSVLLSVLPSCIFIFSGIIQRYLPLAVFGIVFAFCHIRISCKNAESE